jgi:DNA-directed RNA polymerase specialized sigma24 family protein
METPETILTNRFNSQLLQHAIDELPVHYREALLLCDVGDCDLCSTFKSVPKSQKPA